MQDFMKDRYGVDEFTYVLGILGMVLALLGALIDIRPLSWIAIVVVIIALVRAFSKNIAARRSENDAFKNIAANVPGLRGLVNQLSNGGSASAHTASSANAATGSRPKPSQVDMERAKRTAKKMWDERKTTKFLKCPNCGQILSVPKGKGKIRVTCPKCRTKVETKS